MNYLAIDNSIQEYEKIKLYFQEEFSKLSRVDKIKLLFEKSKYLERFLNRDEFIYDHKRFYDLPRDVRQQFFEFVNHHQEVTLNDLLNMTNYYMDDEFEVQREDSILEMIGERINDIKYCVNFIINDDSPASRLIKDMLDKNIWTFKYDW